MGAVLVWWRNVSIIKKLYMVISVMAILIASELAILRFAMHTLSAGRAFVGGESEWSKAQKDALLHLQKFAIERDGDDYAAFLGDFRIPSGDHIARIELEKKNADLKVARDGFLKGDIHPDDIPSIIELLRRFYWVSYLHRAIYYWSKGDALMERFRRLGIVYHDALVSGRRDDARALLTQISALNVDLTALERNFSYTLGEGCRWLERIILSILTMIVLTVECFGLTLAFLISRQLSHGLKHLEAVSRRIGSGELTSRAEKLNQDELGQLGQAINQMGEMLQNSYAHLESRVQEAVATRDEFISVLSHELRSPLTALSLQIDIFINELRSRSPPGENKIGQMAQKMRSQTRNLVTLVDRLLDLTRIRTGQFVIRRETVNLSTVLRDAVGLMSVEAQQAGREIVICECCEVSGFFDATRMSEVIVNLISNAVKYGGLQPIEVRLQREGDAVAISIRDKGPGISTDNRQRIFQRFQRGGTDSFSPGLGLGLYITSEIVHAHGGRITVTSEPGIGTEFCVHLPILSNGLAG